MKTLKLIIITVLVLNSNNAFSQTDKAMSRKTEKIKRLGRDSIINLALKKLNEQLDPSIYSIQIKANKTSVIVSFHIPIVYLPLNTTYHTNFQINLIEETSWSDVISNPNDFKTKLSEIPVYKPTEETQKNINFVFEAINKSDKIGSVNIEHFSFDDSMIIRDYTEYYEITMLSPHQESNYKIDKETGEIYDSMHAHLIPPPDFEDEDNKYEEIKE